MSVTVFFLLCAEVVDSRADHFRKKNNKTVFPAIEMRPESQLATTLGLVGIIIGVITSVQGEAAAQR